MSTATLLHAAPPCSWGTRRASGGPRRLRNACRGKAGCRDAPTHSTARRHVPWGWSVHTSAAELLPEIHMLKPSPRPPPSLGMRPGLKNKVFADVTR